jgi:hypothetical protein
VLAGTSKRAPKLLEKEETFLKQLAEWDRLKDIISLRDRVKAAIGELRG